MRKPQVALTAIPEIQNADPFAKLIHAVPATRVPLG